MSRLKTYNADRRLGELNLYKPSAPTDFSGVEIQSGINTPISNIEYKPPENAKNTYIEDGLRGDYASRLYRAFSNRFQKLRRGEYNIGERVGSYAARHWKALTLATATIPVLTWLAGNAGGYNNPGIGYSIYRIGGVESVYELIPNIILHPGLYLSHAGSILSRDPATLANMAKDSALKHIPWHIILSYGSWLTGSKIWEKIKGGRQKS